MQQGSKIRVGQVVLVEIGLTDLPKSGGAAAYQLTRADFSRQSVILNSNFAREIKPFKNHGWIHADAHVHRSVRVRS